MNALETVNAALARWIVAGSKVYGGKATREVANRNLAEFLEGKSWASLADYARLAEAFAAEAEREVAEEAQRWADAKGRTEKAIAAGKCRRCLGAGRFETFSMVDDGRCFECDGSGKAR